MTFKFISKLSLLLLIGLITFSSCTKEDSVVIVETLEDIEGPDSTEVFFNLVINGNAIETDAVAAYCQSDSLEFFAIANKEENLAFELVGNNFEEGDFSFFASVSEYEGYNWGFGGLALGEDITGFDGLYIVFTDATVTIDSNDGELVIGNSEGTLLGIDPDNQTITFEYPYSIDFAAEVVQESTFCE